MKENKKNVLIVGASSSLGPLIIEKFLAENYSVIATYNNKPSDNKSDDRITSLEVDLLSENSLKKNFEIEINNFSEINLVIFLSGILPGLSLEDYNYKLMKKVMGVNFIGQAETGETITVKSTGLVYRSYLEADQLVISLMKILSESEPLCPIYNVGSDKSITLHELAETIAKKHGVGWQHNITNQEVVIDRYVPNIDKLKALLSR